MFFLFSHSLLHSRVWQTISREVGTDITHGVAEVLIQTLGFSFQELALSDPSSHAAAAVKSSLTDRGCQKKMSSRCVEYRAKGRIG